MLVDPVASQLLLLRDSAGLRPGFVRTMGFFDVFADPALQAAVPPAVSLGPDFETLIYSPALLQAIAPFLGTGNVTGVATAPFDFYTRREFEIYSAELQHIQQFDRNTLLAGGRLQSGEFETRTRLNVIRPNFNGGFSTPAAEQHSTVNFERASLYLYDYANVTPWLTLIGGVSWDRIEHPDNFRNPPVNDRQREEEKVSGKVGFTLAPSKWVTVRGAYMEGLGGVSFDESVRLEPSQVAGFNQAYRTVLSESITGSVEAPEFQIWGLSLEGQLPSRTWWGARFNAIDQDVERTIGAFTGYDLGVFPLSPAYFPDGAEQRLSYREKSIEATINQLLGDQFAVGAAYRGTWSELHTTFPEIPTALATGADIRDEATLHELMLSCNWNSPCGLFARLEANWYSQDLADDPNGRLPRIGDDFWQVNAFVGYRFKRNRGEISVGVLNIGDTDYQLSPLNPYGEIPRERTAVVRCRISF
jgi:outer membrane receptor protein involved in Fe transport